MFNLMHHWEDFSI